MSKSQTSEAGFLSVIICSHNPRPGYLRRTLDALKAQTLAQDQWEFLLVDNASQEELRQGWDLSWHSQARHIREDEIGLTPARLRGIREARGELLVFVDDDNVLQPDYLEAARARFQEWPQLAIIGGGAEGEFELPPPDWTKPMWPSLIVRPLNRDVWTNIWGGNQEAIPYGAGMCVRAVVARAYAHRTAADRLGLALGRRGGDLASGEDVSMILTAFEMGFGVGRFKSLCLTHLIPKGRLEEDYLVRLTEALEYSWWMVHVLHGLESGVPRPSWRGRIANLVRFAALSRRDRRFFNARLKGRKRAAKLLDELKGSA